MHCPKCSHNATKVIDSRVIENGAATRRRRQCESCGYRFTTFERRGPEELIVIKKDATKELYDRSKIKKSILLSFAKRKVSPEQIETLIADLEAQWSKSWTEIHTTKIGEDVVAALKEVDPVAYIRFASVYLKFETLDDFKKATQ